MENLYVPALKPSLKHPTVFKKFDELPNGESFLLINDHDPVPLFYQMKAELGEVFEWKKVENGPELWKVVIKKTYDKATPVTSIQNNKQEKQDEIFVLNVTLIEPKLKHPTIFQHFDALKPGEAFQIENDHDPKPLYYQLIAIRGNVFSWSYLENGPEWWRVQIKKNEVDTTETIGKIAAKDLRKIEVFEKFGIDFCCGGKKTLKQACEEKGLDIVTVEKALKQVDETVHKKENYANWNPDFLADYIYNNHHLYYYNEAPVIADLLEKVANHHGSHYPELQKVYQLYKTLSQELEEHLLQEEQIVFPFIKALVQTKQNGNVENLQKQYSILQPVKLMEDEHQVAGGILEELNNITNHYTAPADACNSFQFLYQKLKELNEDLRQHIHLENNILFPKVLELENELRNSIP